MDEYCKKHCISSYVFLKESSSMSTSQIFLTNSYQNLPTLNSSVNNPNHHINSSSTELFQSQFLKVRSLVDNGIRFIERKLNLEDFLKSSNTIINNLQSFYSINLSSMQNSGFLFPISSSNSSGVSSVIGNASSVSLASGMSSNSSTNINNTGSNTVYADLLTSMFATSSSASFISSPAVSSTSTNSAGSNLNYNLASFSSANISSQINITLLSEPSTRQQGNDRGGSNKKKLEAQLISKVNSVCNLFNTRTRIELIAIEVQDNVIQCLANGLHLEMDEQYFNQNWQQCLDKLNIKAKKQLANLRVDEIIKDLRYSRKSKIFILYSLKSDQFKLLVMP